MKIKNLLTVMTGLALFCLAGCASPQKEAVAKEYAPIEVAVPERPAGQQDVIQTDCPEAGYSPCWFYWFGYAWSRCSCTLDSYPRYKNCSFV